MGVIWGDGMSNAAFSGGAVEKERSIQVNGELTQDVQKP